MHTVFTLVNQETKAQYFGLSENIRRYLPYLIQTITDGYFRNRQLTEDFKNYKFSLKILYTCNGPIEGRFYLEKAILNARRSNMPVYNHTHKLPLRNGTRSY